LLTTVALMLDFSSSSSVWQTSPLTVVVFTFRARDWALSAFSWCWRNCLFCVYGITTSFCTLSSSLGSRLSIFICFCLDNRQPGEIQFPTVAPPSIHPKITGCGLKNDNSSNYKVVSKIETESPRSNP
jgi:hypothetical protein